MRFTIRDLLWLTTLAAVIVAWVVHEQARINRESTLQAQLSESQTAEAAWRKLYYMANDAFNEQAEFYGARNVDKNR